MDPEQDDAGLSRRRLLGSAAAAAGAALNAAPIWPAPAGSTKSFRVALIGCGGRGGGAIADHLKAVDFLNEKHGLRLEAKVVAFADWAKEGAEAAGKRYGVQAEACFGGAEGYRKLLETGPDIVLMATPPVFRPLHLEACINAGKHVFIEKPAAVDPPGVRRVIRAGEEARNKGLVVVAGTQRRHDPRYNQRALAVREGLRGRIFGGRVAWTMGKIFTNVPVNPKQADDLVGRGKWQIWVETSGDHICEQHVHNIDVANWFLGGPPMSATGFGFRAQRVAGNVYDFFSVDFEYRDGIHIHSMCRQIGGCWNWVGEEFTCEKEAVGEPKGPDPYADVGYAGAMTVSEHAHLLWAILKGRELNEARDVAWATGAAILGRESAYSGQKITWDEMFDDPKKNPAWYDLQLRPSAPDFEKGDVVMPKDGNVRIPGRA